MVPKSVVLKAWLSVGILPPHQEMELRDLIDTNGSNIEPAVRTQHGRSTNTEKCAVAVRAKNARNIGEDWLKEISTFTEHPDLEAIVAQPQIPVRTEVEGWDVMREALQELKNLDIVEEFNEDFEAFMNEEPNLSVCKPITILNAVDIAVKNALDELCGIGPDTDGAPKSREEDESEAEMEREPSLASYIALAKELRAEFVCLAVIHQEFGNRVRMGRAETKTKITDFFK